MGKNALSDPRGFKKLQLDSDRPENRFLFSILMQKTTPYSEILLIADHNAYHISELLALRQ